MANHYVNDECGNCSAPCGKARKSCLPDIHPRTRTCQTPSLYLETEFCESLITLTCPSIESDNLLYTVELSLLRPPPSTPVLHYHHHPLDIILMLLLQNATTILRLKRNARLAEALGISQEGRDNNNNNNESVMYSDELVGFARGNLKFLGLLKGRLQSLFLLRSVQMFYLMRKFVHDVYRMDTQMVDQELIEVCKSFDTRIPTPLLSTFMSPTTGGLGRLADSRAVKASQSSSSSSASPS